MKAEREAIMATQKHTFSDILEESRMQAAKKAWEKAQLASTLRHEMQRLGNFKAVKCLAQIKAGSIVLAVALAPEMITIKPDYYKKTNHICLGVKFRGQGALHLPNDYEIREELGLHG